MYSALISLLFEPVILTSTIITILILLLYRKRNQGLPPGPSGLPYFGLLFSIKDENNQTLLEEIRQKYGDIFSFTVTGKRYISLGTVKLIKEVNLSHSDCLDRTMDYTMLSYVFKDGLGFVNGDRWKVLRKYFAQAFRKYGMVALKDTMEGPIYDQVRSTMDDFLDSDGKPIKLAQLLTDRCSTVMRRMLFEENGVSQKEFEELSEAYQTVMQAMGVSKLFIAGSIAKYFIFPLISTCRKSLSSHQYMIKILTKIVERHEMKFDENNLRDVIDGYLHERKERQARNDPTANYFSNEALVSSLEQFMGDGVLAVSYFLSLIMISLVDHPQEQEKMYEEIADVVGTDRLPTMDDKSNLSYTNAYIYEVIRTSAFITMVPSLECKKEITIKEYRIPKGSMTALNLWSAHHDPLAYEDPYKFDPSRFLDKPGKQRDELPIMFGIGKRSCAGESLVMMQVFLYLTATVQNFKVTLPEGIKTVSIFDPESMKFLVQSRSHK